MNIIVYNFMHTLNI